MGQPINFEGSNLVMRAPEGAENVQDMHVYRTKHSCVSCWTVTADELAEITTTGRIFLSVLAGGQQPPVYVGSESTCREVMLDFGPVWPMAPKTPAPEAQAAGSRPMDEASLPSTSRLSQLEARTSCAASVNYQLTFTGQPPQNDVLGPDRPHDASEDNDETDRNSEKSCHSQIGVVMTNPGEPPVGSLVSIGHISAPRDQNPAPNTNRDDFSKDPTPQSNLQGGNSNASRSEQNESCTRNADCCTDYIPLIRPVTLDEPKPEDGCSDVNASVRGISPSRRLTLNKREEVSEQPQRHHAGDEPERGSVQPEPSPEGEATSNFSECGTHVGSDSDHRSLKYDAHGLAKSKSQDGQPEQSSPQTTKLEGE